MVSALPEKTDIIIVGAGICGLTIAREMLKAGKSVFVLEARDRVGGRIQTLRGKFSLPIDAGAEFIHGDAPFTRSLLKESKEHAIRSKGRIYRSDSKEIFPTSDFIEGEEEVSAKLNQLRTDVTLSDFLNTYFKSSNGIKSSVIKMAENFDAADADRLSAFAVREEWNDETVSDSHRIDNGYGPIIDYLYKEVVSYGGVVQLNTIVKQVLWEKGHVTVINDTGQTFNSTLVIITVPLGVLTSAAGEKAHIEFNPSIPEKISAAGNIGYGSVIKVLLQFRHRIWDDRMYERNVAQLSDLGFVISEGMLPVWWTQDPKSPILTGWTGGKNARDLKNKTKAEILNAALSSLAEALHTTEDLLSEEIVACEVINWAADPFTLGAYSYATLKAKEARQILLEPVDETLFFAGEALSEGESTGTVEAALVSAWKLIKTKLNFRL